jgi:hypothetical protein
MCGPHTCCCPRPHTFISAECEPGWFQKAWSCHICPDHTYKDTHGPGPCLPCPTGKVAGASIGKQRSPAYHDSQSDCETRKLVDLSWYLVSMISTLCKLASLVFTKSRASYACVNDDVLTSMGDTQVIFECMGWSMGWLCTDASLS